MHNARRKPRAIVIARRADEEKQALMRLAVICSGAMSVFAMFAMALFY